jgi:hypothetical protein
MPKKRPLKKMMTLSPGCTAQDITMHMIGQTRTGEPRHDVAVGYAWPGASGVGFGGFQLRDRGCRS